MLKTVVLIVFFCVETVMHFFRISIKQKKKKHLFKNGNLFIFIIDVFTVSFEQFNASLLNKKNNLTKKSY